MMKQLEAFNFIQNFKHGLYVCTSDSCQFCQDYKQSIEHVDSPYLFVVEAIIQEQKEAIWKLADRIGFPLTLGFWKDNLQFIKRGQPFGEDLQQCLDFLKRFPKTEMSETERNKLVNESSGRCKLALYVFPQDLSETARKAALCAKLEHNELAIDVDAYASDVQSLDDKVRLFAGVLENCKLVVFNIFTTSNYSELAQELMKRYGEDNYGETTIEHREVQEAADSKQS